MSGACSICRGPGADFDPRELLPNLDAREHRLLDRAIHSRCLASWVYRRRFMAEFHDAARMSGRPEPTLTEDGTLHEGRPASRLPSVRAWWVERLGPVPSRGEGDLAWFLHGARIVGVVRELVFALALAGLGIWIAIAVWPLGALIGGMLVLVAGAFLSHTWRRSTHFAAPRSSRARGAADANASPGARQRGSQLLEFDPGQGE
ncbi:MAG: hypothetical protein H6837_21185 [Planctomycetes bacterium]|nr:hypothetical protein [Planctomycetota bacterium]MCB9872382.1 hypothetical protein [Planctomycetota bacterium]